MRFVTISILVLRGVAGAQPPSAATPKFEVASVKRCQNQEGRMRGSGESSPGRLDTGCDLLADDNHLGLIQRAYVRFAGGRPNPFGVLPIQGGPKWIRTDMYRIEAKADEDESPMMMQGPMLQRVLEERFRLKVHKETKDGPVYALTVEDSGKLKRSVAGACLPRPDGLPPAAPPGQHYCRAFISLRGGPGIEAEGSTLAEIAKLLSLVLDRPVVDRAGLTDRFDLHLQFAADDATPGFPRPAPGGPDSAADPNRTTVFTAIRDLGLKLTASRGPVEILVIDHVERPTAN